MVAEPVAKRQPPRWAGFPFAFSHNAVVAGASASPAAVPELVRPLIVTLDEFWMHIEAVKREAPSVEVVPRLLTRRLGQLPENEIVDFSNHFRDCLNRSNDGCLWVAASVMMGGCGDDSFDYFRGWLIAQGQRVFEAVLAEPDSMAELDCIPHDPRSARLEEMLGVVADAYQHRTGSEDFEILRTRPLHGTRNLDFLRLSEKEELELFPKLAARFPETPHTSPFT